MAITYSVNLGGDKLEITYDGNVFLTSDGQSHSTRRQAQLSEVKNYYESFQQFHSTDEIEWMVDCNLIFVRNED